MELNDGGDIDIATSALPDAVRSLFPHTIPSELSSVS
jgi:tRNA nucleotidyltransferase/poly(A) polymerase